MSWETAIEHLRLAHEARDEVDRLAGARRKGQPKSLAMQAWDEAGEELEEQSRAKGEER